MSKDITATEVDERWEPLRRIIIDFEDDIIGHLLDGLEKEVEKATRNARFALRNELNGKPFPVTCIKPVDTVTALSEYATGILPPFYKEEYFKRLEGGPSLCGGGSFTGKEV